SRQFAFGACFLDSLQCAQAASEPASVRSERIPYCISNEIRGIARLVSPQVHVDSDRSSFFDRRDQIVAQECGLARAARSRQKQPRSTRATEGIVAQEHGSQALRKLGAMVDRVIICDYHGIYNIILI